MLIQLSNSLLKWQSGRRLIKTNNSQSGLCSDNKIPLVSALQFLNNYDIAIVTGQFVLFCTLNPQWCDRLLLPFHSIKIILDL